MWLTNLYLIYEEREKYVSMVHVVGSVIKSSTLNIFNVYLDNEQYNFWLTTLNLRYFLCYNTMVIFKIKIYLRVNICLSVISVSFNLSYVKKKNRL